MFLLMSTPFRFPVTERKRLTTAGSSGWQVFQPSVLAVMILTMIRSLEAFETPAPSAAVFESATTKFCKSKAG